MAYDESFYALYDGYLVEPTVRQNHNRAFRIFHGGEVNQFGTCIDLGCGNGEYYRYGPGALCQSYIGVDRSRSPRFVAEGSENGFIQADYMNLDFLEVLVRPPDHFVSLFSIEACYPVEKRYALYRDLFRRLPSLRAALVSGFYYHSKRGEQTVSEAGDIVSHQTIEEPYDVACPEFTEDRIVMRTPSSMFGDDVVEVWKILLRA